MNGAARNDPIPAVERTDPGMDGEISPDHRFPKVLHVVAGSQ
jgi:hypothetical protein